MALYQLTADQDTSSPASPDVRLPTTADDQIAPLQREIDAYYALMREFETLDVSEIFMRLAAFTARASEVRSRLVRRESKRASAFRTRELDPFIEECERQFRYWSRFQAVRQMEADLTRGL